MQYSYMSPRKADTCRAVYVQTIKLSREIQLLRTPEELIAGVQAGVDTSRILFGFIDETQTVT